MLSPVTKFRAPESPLPAAPLEAIISPLATEPPPDSNSIEPEGAPPPDAMRMLPPVDVDDEPALISMLPPTPLEDRPPDSEMSPDDPLLPAPVAMLTDPDEPATEEPVCAVRSPVPTALSEYTDEYFRVASPEFSTSSVQGFPTLAKLVPSLETATLYFVTH